MMDQFGMLADRGNCDELRDMIRTSRGNLDFRAGVLEALECLHFELTEKAAEATLHSKVEAEAALRDAAALVLAYYRGTLS